MKFIAIITITVKKDGPLNTGSRFIYIYIYIYNCCYTKRNNV